MFFVYVVRMYYVRNNVWLIISVIREYNSYYNQVVHYQFAKFPVLFAFLKDSEVSYKVLRSVYSFSLNHTMLGSRLQGKNYCKSSRFFQFTFFKSSIQTLSCLFRKFSESL